MNIGISRRCGYRFAGNQATTGYYWIGTTNAQVTEHYGSPCRVNCPVKHLGWSTRGQWERAVCDKDIPDGNFYQRNTCPKGWGKSWIVKNSGEYTQYAQGHIDGYISNPVYGYVTRYRDAYYNYFSSRISKF